MDILPALHPSSLVVVYAVHAARNEIMQVVAKLALRGTVTVLDGGNRFQAYRIAHLLRRETTDVSAVANRLYVQRAFTCYQMLALLENTPALQQPYLVLDLLLTFYDDHVKPLEANRLLEACLLQINRLCQLAPVAITLSQPILQERAFLVEKVCANANTVFTGKIPASQEIQLALL
jgi:hypothetical protein